MDCSRVKRRLDPLPFAHFQNQYMPQSHYFFSDITMLENLQKKHYTAKQPHIGNRLHFSRISYFNIKLC